MTKPKKPRRIKAPGERGLISAAAAAMARKRAWSMTQEQRSAQASRGGFASWAGMSPLDRSLEGKRRAAVRKRNRMRALQGGKD